jgi:hypothetical protein
MTPRLQYASQLFLSFNKQLNLKPVAPYLALAGNNFRHSSPLNAEHLKRLSQGWEKVFIVPGHLEYSYYGLSVQIDMNECEGMLVEEISTYGNLHYLNQNSINVNNQIQVSGLMKWPLISEFIICDPIGKYIKPKYKLQCEAWHEEEAEWLHSVIQANSHKKHIIISYTCPLINCLGFNKNIKYYSQYIPLERYEQPIAKWIYGIPHVAFTGYCTHTNTFLACNSKDAKGYYEGMVTHLDS